MPTVAGTGRILIAGRDMGETRYDIASTPSGVIGTISADDAVLWDIHQAAEDTAVLVLESGEQVPFFLAAGEAMSGIAAIALRGHVPGL